MRRFGSDRERRRRRAAALYEFEMVLREEGLSGFVYDEKQDLFRFPDGRFAFSRKEAKRWDQGSGGGGDTIETSSNCYSASW